MSPTNPFPGQYPAANRFWPPAEDSLLYPLRYGDLFATPDNKACRDSKGAPWHAVIALHPSCELQSKGAPLGVNVARVRLLKSVSIPQRAEIVAGVVAVGLEMRVARVNTAYIAGTPDDYASHHDDMFADLRETTRVPRESLVRIAPMSHDARLALLKRDTYFRFRWNVDLEIVVRLEQNRILSGEFPGPTPDWLEDSNR